MLTNTADADKRYRTKLLVFLSVATFFEGFDQMAIAQLLPSVQRDFALDERGIGALVAFVNAGTVLAYILVRQADRWGRKPVLDITIVGYTVLSFLSGLSPNVWVFAMLQMAARIFLIGEWVISTVYAAEEFPAEKRGVVIGIINAFAGLGSVFCAGIVPFLIQGPWGWRTVYFVGTVPLVLLIIARRGLRETKRFEELSTEERKPAPLLRIFSTPHRGRMLQLAVIWFLTYICTQNAITFFKPHAIGTLGMTEKNVGFIVSIGAVIAMPLVFFVGKMLDRWGRKRTATLVFIVTAMGCFGVYTFTSMPLLVASAAFAVFGASAVLPVLNAFGTELFPTHLRGDAFAWSNNLLGRLGYVLSPLAVGALAESFGWGISVAATAVGPILALFFIWKWLPETRGKELEETAAL